MLRIRTFRNLLTALAILAAAAAPFARAEGNQAKLSPEVRAFVVVDSPVFALTHIRVIDGTGGPVREDQTVVVSGGRIAAVGPAASTAVPPGAEVRDGSGHTVIPGLVGMHDHIMYPAGRGHYNTLLFSAPRLYLAAGVTTIRTTGGIEVFSELNLKKSINEGKTPGPRMHVTSPFLEGRGAFTIQMRELSGPEDARAMVRFWAEQGVDDIKVYQNITGDELKAVVEEAHKRGLKVTGHLGGLGYGEAAGMGIDGIEHGLLIDSEFVPGKKPGVIPSGKEIRERLRDLDTTGPEIQGLIRTLVERKVAVTSTLPVFETWVPGRPVARQRVGDVLATEPRVSFLASLARVNEAADPSLLAWFKKEMEFERAFVKAGGLLLAGPDPTGFGGIVPGFGDQREVELLVEAGFTPVEAVKIATYNGAQYLGETDRIGTIAAGKLADIVFIKGNPADKIADIENVEIVFKEGVGYDAAKLVEACRDTVGLR